METTTYDFSEFALSEVWHDGETHGRLTVGPGFGGCWYQTNESPPGNNVLELIPNAAGAGQTFAGLVQTNQHYGDMDFTVRYQTVAQTASGRAPNIWEVAWMMFRYVDADHFYWFNHKTNGDFEIGRGDPAYGGGQRFLLTGASGIAWTLGTWYTLRIRAIGRTITAWLNGTLIGTVTDTPDGTGLNPDFFGRGAIAFYCEDAHALYDDLNVTEPWPPATNLNRSQRASQVRRIRPI